MSKIIQMHTCQCGFSWQHGISGAHMCEPYYRKQIAALNQQVVNLAVENAGLKAWAENRAASDDSFEQEQYPTLKIDWRQRHLKTLQTPVTDAAIANIQAQGVEKYGNLTIKIGEEEQDSDIIYAGQQALLFAAQLRKESTHD